MQDATAILNEISGSLSALASQVIATIPQEQSFMEIWGWSLPAITKHQFSDYIRSPINKIDQMLERNVDESDYKTFVDLPPRIMFFQSQALPQLPGGNAFHVYLTARSLIDPLNDILQKYIPHNFDLGDIEYKHLIPASQLKRLQKIDAGIERVSSASSVLEEKISVINQAHAAAEALPTDLDALLQARNALSNALNLLEDGRIKADAASKEVETRLIEIRNFEGEARQLVKNTEAAYSAATTQGLGKAFNDKAESLSRSTLYLGIILAITLSIGAIISSRRINDIHTLMLDNKISMQVLYINVLLAIVSIAGPIWFAWILTKQIGQRFRLSEDYAFKASVAKAYEGYRVEAVRIDPELEQRLFRSILDRIDEAPLRHVEVESHGSPWHELFGRGSRRFITQPIANGAESNSRIE